MSDLDGTEQAFATAAAVQGTADVVQVEGPEAQSYLEGQLSQGVQGLAVGSSAMSLLLQPQGKIDAWFRLTRLGDDRFWLDLPTGLGEATVARLERFKLRTKVSISLLPAQVVSVRGPAAAAGAEALGFTVPDGGAVLEALWPGTDGFDVVAVRSGSVGDAIDIPDGIDEAPAEALEALRIGLGIPAMGAELTSSTIPAAAGIVDRSVDFTKGCYVGQELVARIDSRGSNTPTHLRAFSLDLGPGGAAVVSVGAEVLYDGNVVGSLTSVAARSRSGPIALGYVKRSVQVPATAEVVADDGQHVKADIAPIS